MVAAVLLDGVFVVRQHGTDRDFLSWRDGLEIGEDMAEGQMHFSLSPPHEPACFSSLNE